ncbi:MAG: hypothetical protein M1819_005301 [Sarea resinae]|nr:MAG: hypothetical protein M1819_005301 [Sarea resinae]
MATSSTEPFPWHLGVFDAHCHPTDTMSSISSIPSMKAKVLVTMATRAEDQDLMARIASDLAPSPTDISTLKSYLLSLTSRLEEAPRDETHEPPSEIPDIQNGIIPSFGWHPWFSHHLYDDTNNHAPSTGSSTPASDKISHYRTVLTPSPSLSPEDEDASAFISALPAPTALSAYLSTLRGHLSEYPYALIGEIGLDRSFRLPNPWTSQENSTRDTSLTPGGRERRRLSPYRVSIDHQRAILLAQLRLAGEMGRAVSVHGVQAHGAVFETLRETWRECEDKWESRSSRKRRGSVKEAHVNEEEDDEKENETENDADSKDTAATKSRTRPAPYPPRICLHSFSGPPETMQQYIRALPSRSSTFSPSSSSSTPAPPQIFFSFSSTINFTPPSSPAASRASAVIAAAPADRILVESDLHEAGERMDGMLESAVRKVCEIRGWPLEDGVCTLGRNWAAFVFGVGG